MGNNGAGKAKNRFEIVHDDASSSCSLGKMNNRAIAKEKEE